MLRKDFDAVARRTVEFTNGDKNGVLLLVDKITETNSALTPIKPLEDWNFPEDCETFLDETIVRLQEQWHARREIEDDYLPSLKPFYGIAEHSAMLGGKVVYGGDTSYHEHPVKEWSDLDKLFLSEDNENFKMLIDSMKYLKKREKEVGYIAQLRGVEAPMDMANAIRGNDLFYDFYDEEENVHKLLEICLEASRFTMKHQKEVIGDFMGGVISGFGVWLPGNGFGHSSEDASSMCSLDIYKEFGRPYYDRMLEGYDSTILHVHTLGRHILPEFCEIDKIKIMDLTYDPNIISPIDTYKEYADILKDKIVAPAVTIDEFAENVEFLADRRSIIHLHVDTLDEAKRGVEIAAKINALAAR